MPRDTLNRQVQQMKDEVLTLGSMVEQAMRDVMDVLKQRDLDGARGIFEHDRDINEKRFAIENAILIVIATQQPMAHDLRMLAAMLEVSTELERMGDYAKGIAKVVIRLGDSAIPVPMREFQQMAEMGLNMLHRALSAFVDENPNLAAQIPPEDNAVDALYNHIYHNLVRTMMANPDVIDQANLLMWVAHNLERLADRVTNICERTVFIATGELLELETDEEENE